MALWRLEVETPLGKKNIVMSGPPTEDAARAELERQQKIVNRRTGVTAQPAGNIVSVTAITAGDVKKLPPVDIKL